MKNTSEPRADISRPIDLGFTAASAQLMANYIEEGKLNPKIEPTRAAFLKMFAAWILEDDLPFTTGETPGIERLFKFVGCKYALPSDTTVRNTLARIFTTLHCVVVKELSVRQTFLIICIAWSNICTSKSVKSKISYQNDTWTQKQMIFTFSGTIASFINDDWKLVERVVDFCCLGEKEHSGDYGAKAFVRSAAARGGLNKISI